MSFYEHLSLLYVEKMQSKAILLKNYFLFIVKRMKK